MEMLGLEGLFAEEGENFERSNESSNCKPGLPQPPAKRAKCGLCGISNQGATCYLNSLLQTLFFTTEFRGISFGNGTKTRVLNRNSLTFNFHLLFLWLGQTRPLLGSRVGNCCIYCSFALMQVKLT